MLDPVRHPRAEELGRDCLTKWQHRHRERVGLRLARQKLMKSLGEKGVDDVDKERWSCADETEDCSSTPLTLLFRHEDSGPLPFAAAYLNVEFLNNHAVLAWDARGCLDVIRLPSAGHSSNSNSTKCDGDPSPMLSQPVSHLESQVQTHDPPYYCALRPLSEGNAFAIGLPSGQMKLFSTERETTCRKRIPLSTDANSILQQQMITNYTKHPFLNFILQSNGAQRRYFRNTDPESSRANFFHMNTIPNWDTQVHTSSPRADYFLREDAIWSFSEENTALTAAHVHTETDCFVLNTLDSRTIDFSSDQPDQSSTNQPQRPKASVYVNITPSECTTRGTYEDITSLTFCTPYQIATAHRIVRSFNNVITHVPRYKNFIKLWDIRMPKEPTQISSLHSRSFPNDNLFSLSTVEKQFSFEEQPSTILSQSLSQENSNHNDSNRIDQRCPEHSMYIANISAPQYSSSSLLCISMRRLCQRFGSDKFYTEDILFDPCTQTVHATHQNVHIRDSHEFELPFPALSQNHEFMACYFDHEENEKISFFDLSNNCHSEKSSLSSLAQSKKRSFRQLSTLSSNDTTHNNDLNTINTTQNRIYPTASFPIKLYDQLGIESYLTSMALDGEGGTFVCGTDTGDLYISQRC